MSGWPQAAEILKDMVRIPTHGREESGVEEEGIRYLAHRFDDLGIPYELQHDAEGYLLNLVAAFGPDGPSVVLNSHMDTVPPGDESAWTYPPLSAQEVDGRIYGRGSLDAKGSLACMVAVIERLWRERDQLRGRIILTAVGAEERGGLGTQLTVKRGLRADYGIIGEPTRCVPHIAHKGALRLALEVTGRQAHSSAPQDGINAVVKMARVVQALDQLAQIVAETRHPLVGTASLAVTTIQGGTALNVIPGSCSIDVDRRMVPGEEPEEALAQVEAVVQGLRDHDPELQVRVETVRALAAAETESERLISVFEEMASQVRGEPVTSAGFAACCDMTFLVHGGGIPTIIFGPGDLALAHQTDESVPVADLHTAAEVYYRSCRSLTEG